MTEKSLECVSAAQRSSRLLLGNELIYDVDSLIDHDLKSVDQVEGMPESEPIVHEEVIHQQAR